MTAKKKRICTIALCLLICLFVSLAACSTRDKDKPSETKKPKTEKMTYTVRLLTEGGMPLETVGIYVYTDES